MKLIDADALLEAFELDKDGYISTDNIKTAITNAPAIEQGEPVATVHRNASGQISLRTLDDDNYFDISKYVGQSLYLAPPQSPSVKDALEKAAKIAREACLIPPDGGSPSEETVDACNRAENAIRNLIEKD